MIPRANPESRIAPRSREIGETKSLGASTVKARAETDSKDHGDVSYAGVNEVMSILASIGLSALIMIAGCGGAPKVRTTFLTSVDLVDMTDQMAESFTADKVLQQRSPQSPQWIVSIDRMHNLTTQVIPEREKWLYLARLRAVLQQSEIARGRNIIWVIPPERWPLVQEELGEVPLELRRKPTHELTAEFGSLTNTSGQGRTDAYLCEYQLVDISDGRIVWSDKWEVKRSVSGKTYD